MHSAFVDPVSPFSDAQPPVDYWFLENQSQPVSLGLIVAEIDDITPLDAQQGVWPRRFCPARLEAEVFGDALIGDAQTVPRGTSDSAGGTGRLYSYALLDAAKVVALPELMELSGLPHRCLFQGAARDALSHVAPYLVRLHPAHEFTRKLFTRGELSSYLWDDAPGILIRSTARLDGLCQQLRKFTRIRDYDDQWFYFRYWEPEIFAALVRNQPQDLAADSPLWLCAGTRITAILPQDGKAVICEGRHLDRQHRQPPRLSDQDATSLRQMRWGQFTRRVGAALRSEGFTLSNDEAMALCTRAATFGFQIEKALLLMARALLIAPDLVAAQITGPFSSAVEMDIAERIAKSADQFPDSRGPAL